MSSQGESHNSAGTYSPQNRVWWLKGKRMRGSCGKATYHVVQLAFPCQGKETVTGALLAMC